MPIIVQSGVSGGGVATTTSVQDILNCASQDVRQVLNPLAGATQAVDEALLIDYVNRISLQMLRFSNWTFLNSAPQLFLTTPGVTDYWIGAVGGAPIGAIDTGLNITDIQRIRRDSIFNRTANTSQSLAHTDSPPLSFTLQLPQQPLFWRNDPTSPFVLNIYPPPDMPPDWTAAQQVLTPKGPVATVSAGGALALRTYYVEITFVDSAGGESSPSIQAIFLLPASHLITVKSPIIELSGASGIVSLTTAAGPSVSQYNVYAAGVTGNTLTQFPSSSSLTRQNASPIAIGTDWTEPTSGLITSGPTPLGSPTLAPLGGYLIDFRYFVQRQTLTMTNQIIQVPDVYKDIVCAGVNWLAYKYLKKDDEAQIWAGVYQRGLTEMVKDANLAPRDGEFVRPDPYGVRRSVNTGIGLDSGLETSIP